MLSVTGKLLPIWPGISAALKRWMGGLTDKGKTQMEACARQLLLQLDTNAPLHLLSSPLPRALQSAEVMQRVLESALNRSIPIVIRSELTERGYGCLEGTDQANWEKVFACDVDPAHALPEGAESLAHIKGRLKALVDDLEKGPHNATFILVTHCDPMQLLLSIFLDLSPRHYSEIRQPENGEFQSLTDP